MRFSVCTFCADASEDQVRAHSAIKQWQKRFIGQMPVYKTSLKDIATEPQVNDLRSRVLSVAAGSRRRSGSFTWPHAELAESAPAQRCRVALARLGDFNDLLGDQLGQRIGAVGEAQHPAGV